MSRSTTTSVDQRLRVLSVMLEPVLSLARVMGLGLDDLQRLVAVGYFKEYRLRGLSQAQIGRHLGKSLRTIAALSKTSSQTGPLLDDSRRMQFQREVVRAGSLGPVTLEAACRLQPHLSPEHIAEALEDMVASGLLGRAQDGFVTLGEHVDLVDDEEAARLDSLRHFLTTVTHVVHRRFFRRSADAEAFARVWTFTAERDALAAFRTRQYESMRDGAVQLEGTQGGDKVQASALLAVVERPDDLAFRGG